MLIGAILYKVTVYLLIGFIYAGTVICLAVKGRPSVREHITPGNFSLLLLLWWLFLGLQILHGLTAIFKNGE